MSLQQRREALVGVLRQYADHSRRRVTVVFDGYAAKHKPEGQEPTHGVEVLFSDKGKTADDLIERLVGQSEHRAQHHGGDVGQHGAADGGVVGGAEHVGGDF